MCRVIGKGFVNNTGAFCCAGDSSLNFLRLLDGLPYNIMRSSHGLNNESLRTNDTLAARVRLESILCTNGPSDRGDKAG